MTTGLTPSDVYDRLIIFQSSFDHLWSKYLILKSSEELFGLKATRYPDLEQIGNELDLLQELYGLYNDVISGLRKFSDVTWRHVDIDKMDEQFAEFNSRSVP